MEHIDRLKRRVLRVPLAVMIEPGADGYIARSSDLSAYGYGDDRMEALDALKV
jgi:hypothetical protein